LGARWITSLAQRAGFDLTNPLAVNGGASVGEAVPSDDAGRAPPACVDTGTSRHPGSGSAEETRKERGRQL